MVMRSLRRKVESPITRSKLLRPGAMVTRVAKHGHAGSVGPDAANALDPENQRAPLRFFLRLQENLDGVRILQTPGRAQAGPSWSSAAVGRVHQSTFAVVRLATKRNDHLRRRLTQFPERLADQRLLTRVESPSQCR